jgi:hypothetical protein
MKSEGLFHSQTLGWAGFIRVDGVAYNFLGNPSLDIGVQKATQKNFKVILSPHFDHSL